MTVLEQIESIGILPVVKIRQEKNAVAVCRALRDGSLPIAEITFRTDAAEASIRQISRELPDVLVGAGTVLSIEQAETAMAAGARFVVTPGFNPEVVDHCVRHGFPILPGCSSPSDIERALSIGIRTVKFFPAQTLGGAEAIKALSAPYADVHFVPTGGVNQDNMLDYLNLSQVAAVGGSWMIRESDVEEGNFDVIRSLSSAAVDKLMGFGILHVGINAADAQEANDIALTFASLFNWPLKIGTTSIFAGKHIEANKSKGRGEKGHIAVVTNNLPRAQAYLMRKGIAFDAESIRYRDDGRPSIIYLSQEIGGFAIHLSQK